MTRLKIIQLAALAFAAGACGSDVVVVCTARICVDALYVKLASTPAGPYRIEVTAPGLSTPRVYDCTNVATCTPVAAFLGVRAATALVTVTYAGRSSNTNVTPVYAPDDNSCGCPSATVTVPLP
jgi:hypothetical protein